LFEHPWLKVVLDTLTRDGQEWPYIYVVSPMDAVAVVALADEGRLVLTRQYRHPVGEIIYDLPAGRMDESEEPLVAAQRELEEETGFKAGRWESLGRYNPYPGSMRAATNLFFATDLTAGEQRLDPGEELETLLVPVEEVLEGILAGRYIDFSLQHGVLLAQAKGLLPLP
jgi:ADP-ribose pyrophosphatase